MTETRTRTLTADVAIPYVGFGTYLVTDADAEHVVREAIGAGYRHIDTAEFYGNEAGIGRGIRTAIEAGDVTRQDIFVTTKLWPGNAAWGDVPKTTDTTIASLDASLARLGLDHVDLYLIHATFERAERIAQWRGLVTLLEQGKTRAIGVSNFSMTHLEDLEAAGLPRPAANQIELHPWSQKSELVAYMADKGITPIAYSSLVPLSTWRSAEGQESAKTDAMRNDGARADSPFKVMAEAHGVSEAQVLLRWAIQKGYPVLPKSIHAERMRQNAHLFSFELSDAEMAAIAKMDRGDGVAWPVGDPTKLG